MTTALSVLTAAHLPDPEVFAACAQSLAAAAEGLRVEWVIVADGDTDAKEVRRTAATAIRDSDLITLQMVPLGFRAGAGSARSIGLARCSADWVTVLDADDLLPRDAIRSQLAALASHPEARWCVGAGETLSGTGSLTFWPHDLPAVVPPGLIATLTRDTGAMPTIPIAGVWHTDTVRRLGAWPALPRDEDTSLKLAVTSTEPGVSVPQSVYVYRRDHAGQATASAVFTAAMAHCRLAALDRLLALARSGQAPAELLHGDWNAFLGIPT
jgi:glycosyltransferase involved in cell wall biosynthesis